jgi:hypothetical protein
MARIRTVKPDFFADEELSDRGPDVQLLFIALWQMADRDGRLEDRPRQIKAHAFPYRDVDVEAALKALAEAKQDGSYFIVRYRVGARGYIDIPNLAEHQRFHKDEKPRGLPPPPRRAALDDVRRVDVDQPEVSLPPGKREPDGTGSVTPARETSAPPQTPGGLRTEILRTENGGIENGAAAARLAAPTGSLTDRLGATFLELRGSAYRWDGLDAMRLKGLGDEADDEIVRRWAIALRRLKYPTCATIADLVKHWNHYAADEPTPKRGLQQLTTDEEFRRKTAHLKTDANGDLVLE